MAIRNKLLYPLGLIFCLSTTQILAEPAMPTGAELLLACQHAREHGYDNTRGMLCIWYVTPCDCEPNKAEDVPRVCLPPGIEHEVLARQVIEGLLDKPGLQALGAEDAAAQILARYYPCEG